MLATGPARLSAIAPRTLENRRVEVRRPGGRRLRGDAADLQGKDCSAPATLRKSLGGLIGCGPPPARTGARAPGGACYADRLRREHQTSQSSGECFDDQDVFAFVPHAPHATPLPSAGLFEAERRSGGRAGGAGGGALFRGAVRVVHAVAVPAARERAAVGAAGTVRAA